MNIQFFTAPSRIIMEGDRLKVVCIRMKLGTLDESGRPRPKPIEGSEFTSVFDTIIPAIGQIPDIPDALGVNISGSNRIQITPDSLLTSREGVFAGGDAVSGPASVIEAIAAGRQASISIDKYLGGSGIINETLAPPEDLAVLPEIKEGERLRAPMPLLSVSQRISSFHEVELGYDEDTAIEEAKYCLMCDLEEREE